MVFLQLAWIVIGLVVLAKSAEQAIRRLVKLARHFGVSEFSISFILVGMVAIFPELSIGISSALQGDASLALGVVLGSNVADVTLVVGIVALAGNGIRVEKKTAQQLAWFLLPMALPVFLLLDGVLSRLDGFILLAAFGTYAVYLLKLRPPRRVRLKTKANVWKEGVLLLLSLAVLLLAGNVVAGNAENVSKGVGLPLVFLGTLLAVGTCLPELTFAVESSWKKHSELGLGNIFGNVLADCMLTLGIVAVLQPIQPAYPQLALVSGGFAVAATVLIVGFAGGKKNISKQDGMLLIVLYGTFLVLQTFLEKMLMG